VYQSDLTHSCQIKTARLRLMFFCCNLNHILWLNSLKRSQPASLNLISCPRTAHSLVWSTLHRKARKRVKSSYPDGNLQQVHWLFLLHFKDCFETLGSKTIFMSRSVLTCCEMMVSIYCHFFMTWYSAEQKFGIITIL